MPSGSDSVARQIRAWLEVRNLQSFQVPAPAVTPPMLPDVSRVELRNVPRLQGSLERLQVSADLGTALPVLASLMSIMDRNDAEGLYNFLIGLIVPEDYDQRTAAMWFRQLHTLSSTTMPEGVTGFFRLLEMYDDRFSLSFEELLSCWLKALRSAGSFDRTYLGIPMKVAARWPERFGFVCTRLGSGGTELAAALSRTISRIDGEGLSREHSELLIDFTIETGWLLEEKDFEQLWQLILRRGTLVHGRLSRGLVPVSSIRFLAGILRQLQLRKALSEYFDAERLHKAMELFRSGDRDRIIRALESSEELKRHLDDQIEMDLVIEVVSHGIAGSDHARIGESMVEFLANTPGGASIGKTIRFLKVSGNEINSEVVDFLAKLVEDTSRENRLSPSNTLRFSKIVANTLPVSSSADRTALKAFYRSLIEMNHSDARVALIQLDKAAFHSGVSLSSVLSASSLLIRAAEPEQQRRYLSRITSTARLVDTLSPLDRKRTLSGLAPLWIEVILSYPPEVEKTIIDFLGMINDVAIRCRYLENVVTRLLQELDPEDPVFRECLSFAVTGYNSAGDIEKLRETEHRVFQKVLRAGGRIEAVDKVITDLLSIPGFEGNRSEELIHGIRIICDRFSRRAVWEEGGDRLFASFLQSGVSNLLRVFVDYPQALEAVDSAIIAELAEKLMPADSSGSDSGITEPGKTASVFFRSILPDCIALFGRDTAPLTGFLFRLAEEITRSIGGMTGDSQFADYLVKKLEQEILQDRVTVLDAWLSQKTPPPLAVERSWPELWREEWALKKATFDNTRLKLFGAVSALVGSTGANTKELILDICAFLAMELKTAKVPGATSISLAWDRDSMEELISRSKGVSPFSLIAANRAGSMPEPEAMEYLESLGGFVEQDIFHGWRQRVLPPLLNCAVEMILVSRNSRDTAMELVHSATEAIEFLGYPDATNFLSTLQQSFLNFSPGQNPQVPMERNFLIPLWRRNSAERLDLLLLGMKNGRLIMDILLERLAMEGSISGRISFMNRYSNFFISVEEALLDIQSESVRSKIAEALTESWIFSGKGDARPGLVEEITEAAEFVRELFRRVRYGSGIVSAAEAVEISADMRRKYRDNADSVAIILRWTVDPAREGLLKMLEESQVLLQAAGTDAELMRLLDLHGADRGFVQETLPLVDDPQALKSFLKERKLRSGG